jgi:hypothetical protein
LKLAFARGIFFNGGTETSGASPSPKGRPFVNNPRCDKCGYSFPWKEVLGQLIGPRRPGGSMWGVACPECRADLKVPMTRVLLIAASGIFFGSQSSTLLLLKDMSVTEFWLAKLWLIVGFYVIATFIFLKLEPVE